MSRIANDKSNAYVGERVHVGASLFDRHALASVTDARKPLDNSIDHLP